jgi:hypothetical protein
MSSIGLAQLHNEYVAAWMHDDLGKAMPFWSDNIGMRTAGANPHSGTYRGKAEVQHNLIDRIYAETTEAVLLGLFDRDIGSDHVFTIVHERFTKADGRVFETKRIVIYRWSGEKIVEVLYFDPDQPAADAFWSDQHID